MEVDGGGVELVGIDGGIVSIRLVGTCLHCPSWTLTVRHGIEKTLKARLPWVQEVVGVT
jgi:Fe-S cluster biogenesis protein NfuA